MTAIASMPQAPQNTSRASFDVSRRANAIEPAAAIPATSANTPNEKIHAAARSRAVVRPLTPTRHCEDTMRGRNNAAVTEPSHCHRQGCSWVNRTRCSSSQAMSVIKRPPRVVHRTALQRARPRAIEKVPSPAVRVASVTAKRPQSSMPQLVRNRYGLRSLINCSQEASKRPQTLFGVTIEAAARTAVARAISFMARRGWGIPM
jgi:hypothetical protein